MLLPLAFKTDLPEVLKALRDRIEAEQGNVNFRKDALRFLKHAQDTINPSVTAADVREMLIQHILTEEIFSQVFDYSNFHRQNNVAKQLYALENTFFTGKVKHDTLAGLRPYYAAIKSRPASCTYQWRQPTPSPPSKKPSRMRNAAERSFWTLPDHPPDLGNRHLIVGHKPL
jgi:predicted helicase